MPGEYLKGFPNPEGSTGEKFLTPPTPRLWEDELFSDLVDEGLDRPLARAFARALARSEERRLALEGHQQRALEWWANTHSHPISELQGWHLRTVIPAQDWSSYLDLGASGVRNIGWGDRDPLESNSTRWMPPGPGYCALLLEGVELDLGATTLDPVTITVEVNGNERWSETFRLNKNGLEQFYVEIGDVTRGDVVRLHTDTLLPVLGGEAVFQRIDPLTPPQLGPEGELPYAFAGDMNDPTATATTAPPAATTEGDVLVFALQGNEILGSPSTPSLPEGVTEIPTGRVSWQGRLAWKRATADDEAGTTSYTSSSGGSVFIGILALPADTVREDSALFGAIESSATNDGTTHPSVVSPNNGAWILTIAFGWSMASSQTNEAIDFPAPTLALSPPVQDTTAAYDLRSGRHRFGKSDLSVVVTTSYGSRYFGTDDRWRVVYALEVNQREALT